MGGYDYREGIYWIYNKSKKNMFSNRDVKFYEEFDIREEDKTYNE